MDDSRLLHRLIYLALLDIRSRGAETEDRVVFGLANLFHNVVLEMADAADGARPYSDVLARLKSTAQENGCGGWLSNAISHIAKGRGDCPAPRESDGQQ